MNIEQRIRQQLAADRIVLYMKGTPTFPQCGFSGRVVDILQSYGVEFTSVNILEDEEVRQGIKDYGNWPTLPQLYVDAELVGGCDIITAMHEGGELEEILTSNKVE